MKKILVVDNEPGILLAIHIILNEMNFSVKTLQSSTYINAEINLFNPDLILLDILLGDADGRVICRNIKAQPYSPLVILFSANDILLRTYKDYEADGYIAKPFDITDFGNMINDYFKKRATIYTSVIA